MDVSALIKAGRLSEARNRLIESVKSSPGDSGSRTLLFQVLAYCGEWDKCRRHLEVIAARETERSGAVGVCLDLLQAEGERLRVLNLETAPVYLPREPSFAQVHRDAMRDLQRGDLQAARQRFAEIDASRPVVAGTLNGKNFHGLRDVDIRLAHVLEAFAHGRYVWIPLADLRELVLPRPKNLLDLLWAQAQVTTWEGLTINAHLPVLYPESFRHEDEMVKLGRITDWEAPGEGMIRGHGQHVFEFGGQEVGLLEIREALFTPPVLEEADETQH